MPTDNTHVTPGVIGAALLVLCCAAPLLIGAVGVAALTAWLTKSVYILIPALLVGLGLAGFALYRRRAAAQICCDPVARKQGSMS
jgi:mercuric ion transport protein